MKHCILNVALKDLKIDVRLENTQIVPDVSHFE